jgi:hypothetical protein
VRTQKGLHQNINSDKSLARLASSSLANLFHEGNEQPERQINKDFPIQLHSPHYSFVSQTQEESISSSQFVEIWLDATELIIESTFAFLLIEIRLLRLNTGKRLN